MENATMNLVATMMKSNFSGVAKLGTTSKGVTSASSSFSNVLKNQSSYDVQSKASAYDGGVGKSEKSFVAQTEKGRETRENLGEKNARNMKKDLEAKSLHQTKATKVKKGKNTEKSVAKKTNLKAKIENEAEEKSKDLETLANELVQQLQNNSEVKMPSEFLTEDGKLNIDTLLASLGLANNLSEEDLSKMKEFMMKQSAVNEMTLKLSEELGMSVDELRNMLQKLEMNMSDLFNKNSFQKFMNDFMASKDVADLLTTDGVMKDVEAVENLIVALEGNKEAIFDVEQTIGNTTEHSEFAESFKVLLTEENSGQGQNQSDTPNQDVETAKDQTLGMKNQGDSQSSNNFNTALQQVVTMKAETVVVNGEIRTVYHEVSAKDIFNQVVTQMKVQVTDTKQMMTIQLQPEHLGKLTFNMQSENGVLTGQFVAESETAKRAIEGNIAALKDQLEEQGIKVDEIKITVGDAKEYFKGDGEKGSGNNSNGSKKSKRSRLSKIRTVGGEDENLGEIHQEEVKDVLDIADNSSIEFSA